MIAYTNKYLRSFQNKEFYCMIVIKKRKIPFRNTLLLTKFFVIFTIKFTEHIKVTIAIVLHFIEICLFSQFI